MTRITGVEPKDRLPEVREPTSARKSPSPSRDPRPGEAAADSPELGSTEEERNRHQRFAHEQYSGSEQGKHGAPTGENLPLEEPGRERKDYPEGTTMPWPADEAVEREQRRDEKRPKGKINPAHRDSRRGR